MLSLTHSFKPAVRDLDVWSQKRLSTSEWEYNGSSTMHLDHLRPISSFVGVPAHQTLHLRSHGHPNMPGNSGENQIQAPPFSLNRSCLSTINHPLRVGPLDHKRQRWSRGSALCDSNPRRASRSSRILQLPASHLYLAPRGLDLFTCQQPSCYPSRDSWGPPAALYHRKGVPASKPAHKNPQHPKNPTRSSPYNPRAR